MLTLTELIVCALAVWEIIEIWRHSLILADWRSWFEVRVDRWGELAQCNFCLSPWVAAAAVGAVLALDITPAERSGVVVYLLVELLWWFWAILRFAIYAFAVARLANLGNDLTYSFCRTPKHNKWLPSPDETSNSNLNSEPDDDGPSEPGDPESTGTTDV